MPPRMADWVRFRIEEEGCPSISDYFRKLVKRDQSIRRMMTANMPKPESIQGAGCLSSRIVKTDDNV